MHKDAHKTRENHKLSSCFIRNSHNAITVKEVTMTNLTSCLHIVARVFLGLLFLVAGLGKLGNVEGFVGYVALAVFLPSLHGLQSYLKFWRVRRSSQDSKPVWRH
jgi:hypothetical protein